jgi:hypothetical protein
MTDDIRDGIRKRMWRIADEVNWLALGPNEKSRYYDNWTKDPELGGALQRYMPLEQVRVYIKDTVLKDYPRAKRADQDRPFRMLGIDPKVRIRQVFIKPHGRLLEDGRVVCWGRAADWKAIVLSVFERSFVIRGALPFGAVFTESGGKFSEPNLQGLVHEVANRLGIRKLVWIE